jgi:hypothetical protein
VASSWKYRILKGASWGIAITIHADSQSVTMEMPHATKIADRLWLQVQVASQLTEQEVSFLKVGLRLVAKDIWRQRDTPVLVRVTGLEFNPCDYQPEGLALAVAGWAAQEFGFPNHELPVMFDNARNRYIFPFEIVQAAPGAWVTEHIRLK